MTIEQFRLRVAAYIKRKNIAPTAFSRTVMGDPAWFSRLMAGAEPKEKTRNKVLEAMRNRV